MTQAPPPPSDPTASGCGLLLALLAVTLAAAYWATTGHVPRRYQLAVIFAGYPAFVVTFGIYGLNVIRAAKRRAASAEARVAREIANRARSEERLTIAKEKAESQLRAANGALMKVRADLKVAEERADLAASKAGAVDARAAQLAGFMPRMRQLEQENAAHAKLTADRRAWRTLPQGHDIESEVFAMAVASALK